MPDQTLTKPLTKNICPQHKPPDIERYQDNGGYSGWRKALGMAPEDIVELVQKSGLRGRGGAGFNTGLKWSLVPRGKGSPAVKYLVCNADEMEPGTFKDRLLMEQNPHLLIEGMAIAAYAIEARTAYIFIRGEYHLAAVRLEQAINEARQAGLIGPDILNSGYSLEIYLHRSAGNYICGEETALLNALEGRRAIPRAKPPFPQVSGLWGKPTVVNNVETLCNIPHLIELGSEWYKSLGRCQDAGSKLFGVSGKVNKPGTWELPMGTPIREIIEEHAGGMRDGLKLKGFLPGGGSTDFLGPTDLDLPMDYDAIAKAGSRMGTGTIIVLDDHTCPVGLVLNLSQFFARESCGWCTPCRDGLPWVVEILTRIENGSGTPEDLDLLQEQVARMGPGNTFCALAPGAAEPLQSALRLFEEEFIDHIRKGRCPYR
ncbi:NADH-quinone oxidoreductase subunit NuoF [Microbulbifer thermotolerans]|uniref:NADH-quinone oxidoreductase subunit NuoF n=1 Tax=Microbulbifer thermotolerans TaxID=252514 RepID=UPI00224B169F|nr:NADH-quinone oxidoreductase subunit NuoF [Microbulbifer thermotolerans]MCX2779031.1 NADH-quinone oxidoreductase subunit NuoF [Microbulbifer thermotolerans]MCX2804671.1 NADH-quinone oxidoreductase subunit NuoF [Microbulbifer thermotolerans]